MHTIHLPDDTFARLAVAAHAIGTSVEEFAVRTLDQAAPVTPPPSALSHDEWQRRFDEWQAVVSARADRYPPGFRLDDSRESIYAGCGE